MKSFVKSFLGYLVKNDTIKDMKFFAAFKCFVILSQITHSHLSTLKPFQTKIKYEYNSQCTLLPQKLFAFIGSDKKVKGRPLAKTYVAPEAPAGRCMNLCASHKHCNALSYKKVHDSENCLLVEANRIVETESAPEWLAYTSEKTCIPGCYTNAGQCLQQVNVTEVTIRSADKLKMTNTEALTDGSIDQSPTFVRIDNDLINELIWVRMAFGKILRVVRVILYVYIKTKEPDMTGAFAVKIGAEEQSGDAGVTKAKYCAHDVSTYPGETKKINDNEVVDRKDIYCYGPIEGKFVYFSKYTKYAQWRDSLKLHEAIVFGEKV